jgi:hypothetical protein
VEGALAEAFQLCGNSNVSISAQIHYHAGRAYVSLTKIDKSKEHFRQAAQIDPNGRFGAGGLDVFIAGM